MPQILVGRYIPIKLLGRGGFGTAFLAIDRYTPTKRKCVVKQFQPTGDLTSDQLQIAQELFEREAIALEQLGIQHPQIPDLLAFFELGVPSGLPHKTDQFFYLVQEFIDGQNMEEELAQKGPFSQSDMLDVLIEVLKILKFVHDSGSIHRDIKPSNIMRGRNDRIYLLDFGAVKDVTLGQGGGRAAHSSTGIYSMGFAPPEQMSGGMVYSATDLYALAVTCITLLTGKQPTDLYDTYTNVWHWRRYTQINDRLADVLDRMLRSVPSQRFQSADEVIEALRSIRSPQVPASPAVPTALQTPALQSTAAQTPATPVSVTPAPQSSAHPSISQSASLPSRRSRSPTSTATASSISTAKVLRGAAFTGFEAGLLAIACFSFFGANPVGIAVWGTIIAGLIILQASQIIEGMDLPILAAISLTAAILYELFKSFAILQGIGNAIVTILFVSVFAGLVVTAAAILFLLIYRLLSRLF
jgi:serine/threonine-protein kinase